MADKRAVEIPRLAVLEAQVAQLKSTQAQMVAEQAAQTWRNEQESLQVIFAKILTGAGIPSSDIGKWSLNFDSGMLTPRHPEETSDPAAAEPEAAESRNGAVGSNQG